MTTTISVKDTATALRQALRAAWPGVKFTVRMNRGTGYGWFNVSWEDGPLYADVDAIADRYHGLKFDGIDDSYHAMPTQLVAFAGEDTPREVRWGARGIICTRHIGDEGARRVADMINAVEPGAARITTGGDRFEQHYLAPESVAALGLEPRQYEVPVAARLLHGGVDFTAKAAA